MPFERKPPGQKWRFSLDKVIPFDRHPCQEKKAAPKSHFFNLLATPYLVRRPGSWAGCRVSVVNMKKLIAVELMLAISAFALGGTWAKANMSYGNGYYTNLCGGGTAANTYSCNNNCVPTSGLCRSNNGGAVRYVCSGKWTGCLESETWGNVAQLGQAECGKTVQLSLYDKKCRQEDGSWDSSCTLSGYMVWYSGDCWGTSTAPALATATPAKKISPTPTTKPLPGVASPTAKLASPTPAKPTPTSTLICNRSCVMDSECGAGFTCANGLCRNPNCSTDNTCLCSSKAATDSGKGSPETGVSGLWGTGLMLVLAVFGWQLTRFSKKVW